MTIVAYATKPDHDDDLEPGQREDWISDLIDAMEDWGFDRNHLRGLATDHLAAWLNGDHADITFDDLCEIAAQDIEQSAREMAREHNYGEVL